MPPDPPYVPASYRAPEPWAEHSRPPSLPPVQHKPLSDYGEPWGGGGGSMGLGLGGGGALCIPQAASHLPYRSGAEQVDGPQW